MSGVSIRIMAAIALWATCAVVAPAAPASGFDAFVARLRPDAAARGVSASTFDRAFAGMTPDGAVLALTHKQAEFSIPIWTYLRSAVSARRVAAGRTTYARLKPWFDKAERAYGVDPSAILGVWGLETDFGGFTGDKDVVRSLATLAYARWRGSLFRDELLDALVILQRGEATRTQMRGSWAGAMGQTQFMPSSFLKYAVDFDGRGRRDIWTDDADAIGSTANYLAKHGWVRGMRWGYEVLLPASMLVPGVDLGGSGGFAAFAAKGVRRADGGALPRSGDARLLLPAGAKGPAFLVTANFDAIRTYNKSISYSLGVATLGDRVLGRPGIAHSWPTGEKRLTKAQATALQSGLKRLGFDPGKIDGFIGLDARAAIRAYQARHGLLADGEPSLALLARVRSGG
ncbi:MAG: lytic murein transglycosylase [Hyphomicrobiales bacterium]|nr:lytic murein transglycosylase [Hyphomicrobiales bacterium]MDE2018024.1 lytic murein transglycosylase [Hyphomicrobiales bacterium]